MKKIFIVIITLLLSISLTSCWENYSTGDRVGLVTEFSETGAFWKSWDGQLNLTQTGMNSSGVEPFDFSFDNDLTNQEIIIESDRNRKYYIDINYYYNVIDPIIYYNMEIFNYMSDITKQYSIVSLSNRIYNMNNLILYVDGLQIDIYKSIIYDYLNIHQTF